MAATNEQLILDPSEQIDNRTSLEITDWIDFDGTDYGEAAIDAFMADRDRGSIPVDYRIPNRELEIPLNLIAQGGTTALDARAYIQAKAALFQKEGGILKRITNSGGTVYADIVNASFTATSVSGFESAQSVDLDASLHLEVLPDWYGPEVTLSDHTETTNPELVFTETAVDGDYPARCRIVFDEDQGADQRGLIWGFRSRHYSAATTAATKYEAEALNPVGQGTIVATTNASGGTAVKAAPLFPQWSPVLKTPIGGTSHLTHTGTNRVYARCIIAGTAQSQARLSWDVGDLTNAVVNPPFTFPNPGGTIGGTANYIADLGEVRLDPPAVGTHRWQGQIDAQAYNTNGGTVDFRVDRLWIVNEDEGSGKLTAPLVAPTISSSLSVYDTFDQSAGNVASGTAPLGGNYDPGTAGASTAEDGDADDCTFTGTGYVVRNAASADSSITNGRYTQLDGSSTISALTAQLDVALPGFSRQSLHLGGGILVRFVDTDNWLMLIYRRTCDGTISSTRLSLWKRVAGTATSLADVALETAFGGFGGGTGWKTIKLTVDAQGNWVIYTGAQGSTPVAKAFGQDTTHLQTGQTLDDGKVGFYDMSTVGSIGIRAYDNFNVQTTTSTTVTDAAVYASRSAQLTTDGHYRLDTGGTAYGPISSVNGDLPRLPVAGLENRTTEVFLKASRGDFDTLADSGIDDCSARVSYNPCWLHVPDA